MAYTPGPFLLENTTPLCDLSEVDGIPANEPGKKAVLALPV
jgi:hypothetical protein